MNKSIFLTAALTVALITSAEASSRNASPKSSKATAAAVQKKATDVKEKAADVKASATAQTNAVSEADQAAKAPSQELTPDAAKAGSSVQVDNIVSLNESTETIQGKKVTVIALKAADGKTYSIHQEAPLTDMQREKLKNIKSATLHGVTPIDNRPNEFLFSGLEEKPAQ